MANTAMLWPWWLLELLLTVWLVVPVVASIVKMLLRFAAIRELPVRGPIALISVVPMWFSVVPSNEYRPSLCPHHSVPAIGLASRPSDRFATGAELAAALRDELQDKLDPAIRSHAAAILQTAGWSSVLPPRRSRSRAG